jgi:hypothetical protein
MLQTYGTLNEPRIIRSKAKEIKNKRNKELRNLGITAGAIEWQWQDMRSMLGS